MTLNASPVLTTPHFLIPAQTFLTKFSLNTFLPSDISAWTSDGHLKPSVPKMELLTFPQMSRPDSLLLVAQVNALKPCVTLLSHPQCIRKYCSFCLQNMPKSTHSHCCHLFPCGLSHHRLSPAAAAACQSSPLPPFPPRPVPSTRVRKSFKNLSQTMSLL